MTQESGKPKRTNYLPYILIGVGAVILLGNITGGFTALRNVFLGILSLWPIVLIAVGVDLLTGGKHRAIIAAAAVVVGLVMLFAPPGMGGTRGSSETQDVRFGLEGASRAEVSIDLGVADLTLRSSAGIGGAATSDVVTGTVTPSRGERFEASSRRNGQTLEVDLRSRNDRGWFGFGRGGGFGGGTWDLTLSERVPIGLEIDTGVGESHLDLRGVQLIGFDLDAGVGNVVLVLPDGNYTARIDGGVGTVTLRLPQGIAAMVRVDTGLGGVDADGGYQRSGDTYTTATYAGSGVRVDISAGVGQVHLETVR